MRVKRIAFILDHELLHYRVPLFEALSDCYDITVFHKGPKVEHTLAFSQHVFLYKKLGPFQLISNFPSLSSFDAVVIMQNLRVLNLYTLPIKYKKKPILMWGIGTSSSRGLGSESRLSLFIRNCITLLYKGVALYSQIPVNNYWNNNRKKISVVGNSVINEKAINTSSHNKKHFLFFGSLNKRKGLIELIEAFKKAISSVPNLQLLVVGDGEEKDEIEQKVLELELKDNVQLLGAIYDRSQKQQVFSNAYCVISPLQAGLSVVESFSYGVPFVTSTTAISGGEAQSIIHDENGVLFNNIETLSDIIVSFVDGRRNSAYLGNNAFNFYQENLRFDLYVNRFKEFIEKHS